MFWAKKFLVVEDVLCIINYLAASWCLSTRCKQPLFTLTIPPDCHNTKCLHTFLDDLGNGEGTNSFVESHLKNINSGSNKCKPLNSVCLFNHLPFSFISIFDCCHQSFHDVSVYLQFLSLILWCFSFSRWQKSKEEREGYRGNGKRQFASLRVGLL